MTPTTQPNPKPVYWVLWAALLFAVIIYYVVLQTTSVEPSGPDSPVAPAGIAGYRSAILTISFILLVPSFGLRFFVTRRFAQSTAGNARGITLATYIVSLALAETPAMFGMVLGLGGVPNDKTLIFFLVSLGGLLFQPPTFLSQVKEPRPGSAG